VEISAGVVDARIAGGTRVSDADGGLGWARAVVAPMVAAVAAFAAVGQGAFYWPRAGVVAATLTALVILTGFAPLRRATPALFAFGALAIGLLVSAAANGALDSTWPAAATLTTAAAGFVVGRALVVRGERHLLLQIMAGVGAMVGVTGLVGLAFHIEPWGLWATELWRASTTLTYANAGAALLVLCLPAALLLGDRTRTWVTRLTTFAILTSLVATLSRGGALALVVSAACIAVLGAPRLMAGARWPAVGAGVAFASFIPSIVGDAPVPLVALAGLIVGSSVALVGVRERAGMRRWIALALAVTAVWALAGWAGRPVTHQSSPGASQGIARLTASRVSAAEPRFEQWSAALSIGVSHPIVGVGPGRFSMRSSRFAHNEYLQSFAETGFVGLGTIAFALVVLGAWVWRSRPKRNRLRERAIWVSAVGASAAFLAHSSVDFLWRFPILVLLVVLWLSVAVTRPPVFEGGEL